MRKIRILQWLLLLVIAILCYFIWHTIADPIRFSMEKEKRYGKIKERLRDIRTAQLAHKEVKGYFSGDIDSLRNFVKFGKFVMIKKVPSGRYEPVLVNVRDSVYSHGFISDSLPYVPYTNGQKFRMRAGEVDKGGVKVNVFMAEDPVPFDSSEVLRVGSMTQPTYAGNWE